METNNEDDINVDIAEVRKVLEDANLYEPNMSRQLMKSYYEALNNSKDTASEEDQTRRLNESQEELEKLLEENIENNTENTPTQVKEKPFIPKVWSASKNTPLEDSLERNNNENIMEHDILEESINSSPKDATKVVFGFNEMKEDSNEPSLNIISYELKFVSIQNSSKFLNAGPALKAKMLYAYHTKANKMKAQLARLSFYPAPLPKITSITETFPSFSESNNPETYVCRSGRQTKRKIYNYDDEDDDSLDGTSNKKVKNSEEEEWFSKAAPKNPLRSNKKQDTSKANPEVNKTESEIVESNKDKKIYTPLSKRTSNADIMKRSRLFSDGPKRTCEIMFDKLKTEEEKKAREEKKMEIFKRNLEKLDEEKNEVTENDDIITVDDEEAVRIRVVPQIPKKFAGKKRNNPEGINSYDTSQDQKKDGDGQQASGKGKEESTAKINLKKRPAIRKLSDSPNSLPSTSRIPKTPTTKNVACPICGDSFEEDKIVEHASSCGDEPVTRSSLKVSRITCEICDKVVNFDTSYEVHVKDCIAKKREKDY